MSKTTFFVEGIQGSGKSTMVGKLANENPELKRYQEGDYSPVELAWCTYVDEKTYEEILGKYSEIADEIRVKTVVETVEETKLSKEKREQKSGTETNSEMCTSEEKGENKRYVIPYTQILTDIEGFHRDLEQYEIYNGNRNKEEFEEIVLQRFEHWNGEESIFECSIFQNIIENQILFFEMTDDEIVEFYKKVKSVLEGKAYKIVYLEVDDIWKAEDVIRKERCDENGNELWFLLMTRYLEESPYGKRHQLKGMDGLVSHLQHRVKLERRILQEVFEGQYVVQSRNIEG